MNSELIEKLFREFKTNRSDQAPPEEGKDTEIYRKMMSVLDGYEDHYSDMARSNYLVIKARPEADTVNVIVLKESVFNMWREERVERYRDLIREFTMTPANFQETVGELKALIGKH